jgi:ABC-type cobalamin/Fe3+-siderophores transport system ATPase subunit
VFGPSGAGKSSLVKTFYRSLHQKKQLPEELKTNLSIKDHFHNEGTTIFTPFIIKQPFEISEEVKNDRLPTQLSSSRGNSGTSEMKEFFRENTIPSVHVKRRKLGGSSIIVHDTRG